MHNTESFHLLNKNKVPTIFFMYVYLLKCVKSLHNLIFFQKYCTLQIISKVGWKWAHFDFFVLGYFKVHCHTRLLPRGEVIATSLIYIDYYIVLFSRSIKRFLFNLAQSILKRKRFKFVQKVMPDKSDVVSSLVPLT